MKLAATFLLATAVLRVPSLGGALRFQGANPCPATGKATGPCPGAWSRGAERGGYVIDHIVALKRGGPDTPENMQWQTVAYAKAKDRIESELSVAQ
jgi:hypothetical protein